MERKPTTIITDDVQLGKINHTAPAKPLCKKAYRHDV